MQSTHRQHNAPLEFYSAIIIVTHHQDGGTRLKYNYLDSDLQAIADVHG